MQVINMSNSSGTDSLTLNTDTVLHLGNAGLFTGAGTTPSFIQMQVKGDVGDTVTLQKLVGSVGKRVFGSIPVHGLMHYLSSITYGTIPPLKQRC